MPDRLLYTFYGDDFTGSTDVLEALASNGVETVLFLAAPTWQQLAGFPQARAIGIAGSSRSQTPAWMDQHLPPIFRALKELNAPIAHYKTCSTFDSAPHIGSIGHALDLGREHFQSEYVPIVVAAPHLGRYVLFSNLFAEARGQVYRIDQHPAMRNHPVTPMQQADLRRHLAAQTSISIGSVDIRAFTADRVQQALAHQLEAGAEAIVFDGLDNETAAQTGHLLWSQAEKTQSFVVGSSGLTQALVHEWRTHKLIAPDFVPKAAPPAQIPAKPIIVLSGSCSPATAAQIEWALVHGFAGIALDVEGLISGDAGIQRYRQQAMDALLRGQSVIIYSALGTPSGEAHGEVLGIRMGQLLRELLLASGVRRVVIAGGDTSSHVTAQLGLHALTFAAPLQPGVPLCRAYSAEPALDGLELALKGGQIGPPDFFGQVLRQDYANVTV